MKYMSFNSSCSYAGIANMLETIGIQVEDREIALKIELPYLIVKEEKGFAWGPKNQGKKFFDLFLNGIGFVLREECVKNSLVPQKLESVGCAMVGIRINERQKHAVVFDGMKDGKYHFVNNRHRNSDEDECFLFTKEELCSRLDEEAYVCCIEKFDGCRNVNERLVELLEKSQENLDALFCDFNKICSEEIPSEKFTEVIDGIFRPLLLDGESMMELMGRKDLAEALKSQQEIFVDQVFRKKNKSVILADYLDMEKIHDVCTQWKKAITSRLQELKKI